MTQPKMASTQVHAHSAAGRPAVDWEPLSEHHAAVGKRAADLANTFGWCQIARIAGALHDTGKCSPEFQTYIRKAVEGGQSRGPDHSSAGAQEAVKLYPGPFGRIVAFLIAGHHAGLADGADLDKRLTKQIPPYEGWEAHTCALPAASAFAPLRKLARGAPSGFSEAFLIRMLFSCLVDADFIETERFYAEVEGRPIERGGGTPLPALRDRVREFMARKQQAAVQAATTGREAELNALRAEILVGVIRKAALPPGLFTLTVPTGGGKTLASLSFALEHALHHGLRRVIYVIPFASIIEQTAAVFRVALGLEAGSANETDILEHHATFDWEASAAKLREDGRGTDPLDKLRRAAENWDAPIVVTTAVQFFESLFGNRTSRCRKLHNVAKSVIVLDEAQTLPLRLLKPCMAALDELARNYGASVVLCTATQPALREKDGFTGGFKLDDDRELAPDPQRLYAELKRVEVERLPERIGDSVIAARFAERDQMLCIVNTRRHATALFDLIRDLPGAVHLTTMMCPRHRRIGLEGARARLKAGEPVRIVSTSLIEAGVDIDLPEVWRASTGIDSIAQAAGRCNREFRLRRGRVVVFEPAEGHAPHDLEQAWQAGRRVLPRHADPLGIDAVRDYFGELYWQKGDEALDSVEVAGRRGILPAIRERADTWSFPFRSIAEAFRVIEDAMEPVVVPWKAGPDDTEAETILGRIAKMDRPLSRDLRKLQQYTVSIPPETRRDWLARGVLRPVHPGLGEALLRFEDLAHYDDQTGVRLDEPTHRSGESNLM